MILMAYSVKRNTSNVNTNVDTDSKLILVV